MRDVLLRLALGVAVLTASGCERDLDETREAPGSVTTEENPESGASAAADADDSSTPVVPLVVAGRVDVDGYVHPLAVSRSGNVVATTRQGRAAAYLLTRDMPQPEAPASIELGAYVSAPIALGSALFALPQPATQRVDIVRIAPASDADNQPTGESATPVFDRVQTLELDGMPGDMAVALGRLWIAVRQTEDGRGLVALDPTSGDVLQRIASGPLPIDLVVARRGSEHETLLAVFARREAPSQLAILDAPAGGSGEDAEEPDDGAAEARRSGRVTRVDITGMALAVLAPRTPDERAWVTTRESTTLIGVEIPVAAGSEDAVAPRRVATVEVPFVPRHAVRGTPGSGLLYVAHGDGRVARVRLADGPGAPLDTEVTTLGMGTIEMIAAELEIGEGHRAERRDVLFVLDPASRRLEVLDAESLEKLHGVSLGVAVGRMVWDATALRMYVTLPERQQIAVIQLERPR